MRYSPGIGPGIANGRSSKSGRDNQPIQLDLRGTPHGGQEKDADDDTGDDLSDGDGARCSFGLAGMLQRESRKLAGILGEVQGGGYRGFGGRRVATGRRTVWCQVFNVGFDRAGCGLV